MLVKENITLSLMALATPTASQKLGEAESIARALGASQPELALPCLDLVTVFEVSVQRERPAENADVSSLLTVLPRS